MDIKTPSRASDTHLNKPARRPLSISPKKLLLGAVCVLVVLGTLHRPLIRCYHRVSEHVCGRPTVEARARQLLANNPLIDGHIDFPVLMRMKYENRIDNADFASAFENGTLFGDLDLKRLRDGQSGGAFWSVWAPCPRDGRDFSDANMHASVQFTLDEIDVMQRLQGAYPNDFSHSIGLTSDDARRAFKNGKFISPLGIEGLHQIGNRAANLRRFYALGVRYATLTHNCHNKYADGCQEEYPLRKSEPLHGGLSVDGRKLVNEMNRIGMIVDISHVSADTMLDVLGGKSDWAGSRAPVMFSHSSVYSICPHPRNVPDEVLKLVKERNSIVMINIAGQFISCKDTPEENGVPAPIPENFTLAQVVKHIMYVGEYIGYDYVGIGTDLDGIPDQPEGFEDVTKYPALVAELLNQGVSEADVVKIVGGNVLRVWKDVETVAAELQAAGEPVLEDDVVYDGPY